jgi:hypothetical protein
MLTKTDFLGNEYGPGDFVIYAQSSGRCINMVKGQVVEILESGSVKVLPIAGSRWTSHRGKTYMVDNRTGKRIDPWRSNGKHIKENPYYVYKDTGERVTQESERLRDRPSRTYERDYIPTKFHDYVEARTDPVKPVTISVTENIVKFADGELPVEV